MCGIAGIVRLSTLTSPPILNSVLESMANKIRHRGPDDGAIYNTVTTGLAHRRLSIIDINMGAQPMHSSDGSVSLVFNGEIFNYVELREKLVKKGHQFVTRSDTEVIIHLYQEYGLDFVQQLNGQFAIGLWDEDRKRLLLVRDRVGICPLYYTVDQGRLIFASEIKALKPALNNGLEISSRALDQLFTFWTPVSPNTLFKDVFEVSPGQMLVVEKGEIQKYSYWDWEFSVDDYWQTSESEQAEELLELLQDATKIRLRADVPVGAYLSGGLDSSALVSLIHNSGKVALTTFSLNFAEKDFDERHYQSLLIQQLRLKHNHLTVDAQDIAENLKSTIYHAETPILRTAPVPMGLLSSLVKKNNYKVVLTGEGADEVLGGYDIFKEAKVRQFWAVNPDSMFRPLLLKKLYPYLNLPDSGQAAYLKKFFAESLDQPKNIFFSHLPRWTTTAKAKLFYSEGFSGELAGTPLDDLRRSLPSKLIQMNFFNRAQYIESKSLMPGYLLSSQGDRMLTKHSIEGRYPFLDHRLIEFSNRIPPKYKMKGLCEKYLLKKAMKNRLPEEIIRRYKQPYRSPDIATSVDSVLSEELRYYLSPDELKKNGFFDNKKVEFLLKKTSSNRALSVSDSQALIGILSTQILAEQFL